MYVSTCMHLYRTFIPCIIARVLVYLIFLLLRSTYIIISLIPVLLFHILDLRWVATTLALIIPHNSNYNIRPIRSTFSASTVVIRSLSIHPSIHPHHVFVFSNPSPECVAPFFPRGWTTHTHPRLVRRPLRKSLRPVPTMGYHWCYYLNSHRCSLERHCW